MRGQEDAESVPPSQPMQPAHPKAMIGAPRNVPGPASNARIYRTGPPAYRNPWSRGATFAARVASVASRPGPEGPPPVAPATGTLVSRNRSTVCKAFHGTLLAEPATERVQDGSAPDPYPTTAGLALLGTTWHERALRLFFGPSTGTSTGARTC